MAFRGNNYKPKARKKKGSSLYYPYTEENMKHAGWCINNGIGIAVSNDTAAASTDKWKIEIRFNKGPYKRDPAVYEYDEAMKKLYEYYKYYYDKYNK